jgi:hypothetical protein
MHRRQLLAAGLALSPLTAALQACSSSEGWPEGMQPIKWDRDTCVRCNMVISDRRFAAQMRGGPRKTVFKFDDIGCAAFWLRDKAGTHPWMPEVNTQLWVADFSSDAKAPRWLDARRAQYTTRTSPMGYNFGAVAQAQAGSVDFATMREHVLAKGR